MAGKTHSHGVMPPKSAKGKRSNEKGKTRKARGEKKAPSGSETKETRARASKEAKKQEVHEALAVKPVDRGPAPQPRLSSLRDSRVSRGFSILEVKDSGLTFQLAKSLGIRVDPRRRSSKELNRNLLTSWLRQNLLSARTGTATS